MNFPLRRSTVISSELRLPKVEILCGGFHLGCGPTDGQSQEGPHREPRPLHQSCAVWTIWANSQTPFGFCRTSLKAGLSLKGG